MKQTGQKSCLNGTNVVLQIGRMERRRRQRKRRRRRRRRRRRLPYPPWVCRP